MSTHNILAYGYTFLINYDRKQIGVAQGSVFGSLLFPTCGVNINRKCVRKLVTIVHHYEALVADADAHKGGITSAFGVGIPLHKREQNAPFASPARSADGRQPLLNVSTFAAI